MTPEGVEEVVRRRFGRIGSLTRLPGDRDLNFLMEGPGGERSVVKVTSPEEPDPLLELETGVLSWLARGPREEAPLPAPIPALTGDCIVHEPPPGEEGPPLRFRVLNHLQGVTLAEITPRPAPLLEELGRAAAALSLRLAAYPGEVPLRPGFRWAMAEASVVMEGALPLHQGEGRRLVEGCLEGFQAVEGATRELPTQLIHGDLNDHNVLVDPHHRVSGILDLGDAHRAPALFDLAIAAAYGVAGSVDPVMAAARVVAGWHRRRPLEERELGLLFPLIRARMGVSVSISAIRRSQAKGREIDPYHQVSQSAAWALLQATEAVHPRLAAGFFREACGFPPVSRTPGLTRWLAGVEPASVLENSGALEGGPGGHGFSLLDLSVGSSLLDGRDTEDTAAFSRRVEDAVREAGAFVGVGRYREPRGFYLTDAFSGRPSEPPERRTVHMGIDLFAPAGANVRAPLPGRVRSVHDNSGRLDYGPTVILEHEAPDGPFWTLFGHLERSSVDGLSPGDRVEAGQVVARLGPPPENGDWPPHLHFQIVTDLLGSDTDFPGVVAPREVEVWAGFLPDPNLLLRLPLDTTWRAPQDLRERRARLLGPNLSLSYREPIHLVRGRGSHLYDLWGREYLDCVNNVAHVGHEHPRVVEAGQRQMAVLNTNTRYLHEGVLAYAERLSQLLPEPLAVCYFVNSGSEANELALRIARTVSGRRGMVVLEGGYHGHTGGLVEVSHYKYAGPGGAEPPPWVAASLLPDDYRGPYRRDDPNRGTRYAGHVDEAVRRLVSAGHPPAALLAESILSCGGQVEPPPGFFQAAAAVARDAGALYVADEVQVGFGRVGSHLWGFQRHGVVPDIVTLGKPMGNGHPMGAVVTTPEIARAFANGMEFFSTFGGNPVSAAIGLAVLDVLEEEGLQGRAVEVGGALTEGLGKVQERHPCLGDVRGAGLFLGVEIVEVPARGAGASGTGTSGPTPDRARARRIVERMKEKGILLSTDGPADNVLKIKPPLSFSQKDGERVVEALDAVLGESWGGG